MSSLVLSLLLLFLFHGSICINATDADQCFRSCGMIHNISHPFRLEDSPKHCGDRRYTLSCEDNQLVLYWKSGRYYVQSINYNNYTIRLVDANIRPNDYSSLPLYSLAGYNFTEDEAYQDFQNSQSGLALTLMLYLRCPYQVNSSYLSVTCVNSSYVLGSTSYFIAQGYNLWDLGLGDSCRIDLMYLTSWPDGNNHNNISCTDIHNMLLYGFELSWAISFCKDPSNYVYLDDHNKVICIRNKLKPGFVIYVKRSYNSIKKSLTIC